MIDNQGLSMTRILLLGGTTEAGLMAQALADAGIDAVYSYAGRTADPAPQPLPQRVGGFGGIAGLTAYLQTEDITHLIDATHPFAEQMSRHAIEACAITGVALAALERPAWQAEAGDDWTVVPDEAAAARALPDVPARVFLAIGRQTIAAFACAAQHHYLLRLVDPPTTALPLPRTEVVIARGPFLLQDDLALMRQHRIDIVVAKNSGGEGARAKVDAARQLGLPVVMINRPALPSRLTFTRVTEVMDWLDHPALLGV